MVAFRLFHLVPLILSCRAFVLPELEDIDLEDAFFSEQSVLQQDEDMHANAAGSNVWDVVVVGGGPAGLSALSGLARVGRKVALIDSGSYRNGPTRHMHDVIGSDGLDPAVFRETARELLSFYPTITMLNGTVNQINSFQNADKKLSFKVEYDPPEDSYPGVGSRLITTKKIVLATGVKDILPEIPGVAENWGKGIFWCPWCDGYEHKGQKLAVIGPALSALSEARIMLSGLNKEIEIFTNGEKNVETAAQAQFRELNHIDLRTPKVKSIVRIDSNTPHVTSGHRPSEVLLDKFRVTLENNRVSEHDAILLAGLPTAIKSPELGVTGNTAAQTVKLDGTADCVNRKKDKLGVIQCRMWANETSFETSVNGIYVAGDVNMRGATNVPFAMYSGKKVAVYLHVQLARDEEVAQLTNSGFKGTMDIKGITDLKKRGLPEDETSVWKRMNDDPKDPFYVRDEFEQ